MDGAEKRDDLDRSERTFKLGNRWEVYNCAISNLQRLNDMEQDFGIRRVYKQAGTVYLCVIDVVREVDC